jgi:hypothetical protein
MCLGVWAALAAVAVCVVIALASGVLSARLGR